ncbi:hypothetical protein [Arenibacterium sp. LLYu02]|uniref:hypothetical protein n=1 Tax=Arenibacterium sp. LLYu02 TaxID=3404132 RepID=UPI003B2114A8
MIPSSQALIALSAALLLPSLGQVARAEGTTPPRTGVQIELNALTEGEGGCRLSFLAQNASGQEISEAIYETVLFDRMGGVMLLTLFDFRDLPLDRPRVRQFDLGGVACAALGRVLINGASRCVVEGQDSAACTEGLTLSSRTDVEVLG